jgi:putative CocE/NonD family hydrolase
LVKGGLFLAGLAAICCASAAFPETAQPIDPVLSDKIGTYDWVRPQADYVRRQVMIPMRDGKRLYTVIVHRKGISDAPILLSRTPYDAASTTARIRSQKIEDILPIADADFARDNYIRVYQDVRGMDRSEGEYVVARPLRGPLNRTRVDHSTDAWDTIDWLIKNVPESNGKVGVIGSSYVGFTSLMALIDPHPALKAAVPQGPMVDGWIGDDWFHNGAFRPLSFDYLLMQTTARGGGPVPLGDTDEYSAYLEAGSSADYARLWGIDQLPAVRKMLAHPAYDAFWQGQALDKLLAKRSLTVPVLLVASQWDQEDSYGAFAVYQALEAQDTAGSMVNLALGPWPHSGVNFEVPSLGVLAFPNDTAAEFRSRWMKPFLDCHLKSNPPPCDTPPVVAYATGANRWESLKQWPSETEKPLYLAADHTLSFARPDQAGTDSWISDPANPVPMLPRPIHLQKDQWRTWLVADQRFLKDRGDVLTYVSPVLDKPMHVRGAPRVELHAATSGQDADWVVKLIDAYPEGDAAPTSISGYQLPLGIEIFRGRYVHGFSTPAPLEPGRAYSYEWRLPNIDHVIQPGHRLIVQVQSSLFPLYERNPQGWAPVIFEAKPGDYAKATQTVHHGGDSASAVWLPVVEE